jgi:hypothetical protein
VSDRVTVTRRLGGNRLSSTGARQFRADLRRYGHAYARQTAIELTFRVLALTLAVDVAILLISRLVQVAVPPVWLAVLPIVGVVVAATTVWWRKPSQLWLASEIDRRLGLRERAITALELSNQNAAATRDRAVNATPEAMLESSEERSYVESLAGAQVADAVAHLRQAEPVEVFSPRLPRIESAAILALVLVIAFAWRFEPARPPSPAGADIQRMAYTEAERLDSLLEEIESGDASARPEQEATREEIARIIREASEALKDQTGNPDQTFARLSDLERRLAALQNTQSLDVAQALSRLADAFDRAPETRSITAALDRRDFALAAAELQRLGREAAGSETQRQALAEALRQAAKATERHDQALAESLRQAVDRLNRGEDQSPTDQAADELRRAGEVEETDESLQRALNQMQQARRALVQGANPATARDGGQRAPGEGAGSAQSRADDGSDGSGQGDGDGQGEGQRGSGSGAGTGSSQTTGGTQPISGTRARQVQVPTGDFDRPTISESEQTAEGDEGEVTVDYRSVLPVYQERATRALQDRYVPHAMKDLVREYFSSLQPTR